MFTRTSAIAALTAVALLPAAAAAARPVKTAGEASTVQPASALGSLPRTQRMSLPRDRKMNLGRIRGVKAAKKRAARRLRAVMSPDKTVAARVLLVAGDGNEPSYAWWRSMLTAEGVPFDSIITATAPPIISDALQYSPTQGKYQAVILATGLLIGCVPNQGCTTPDKSEFAAIQTYEKDFAVREIDGYQWPTDAQGADWQQNDCGLKSGITLTVTDAGKSVFSDLTGSFPTDKGVWGCETGGMPGSSFQPLVKGPNGTAVSTFTRTDGVETMANFIDGSDWTINSKLLFHGMLKWVTNGHYIGAYRNYFGIDVDDVFMGNDRWDPATNTLMENNDATVIRMTPKDVDRAVAWEARTGVSLNLLFNAESADMSTVGKGRKAVAADPLSQALIANRSAFRWTSHTFDHADLDAATQQEIQDDIKRNVDFANKNKLPGFNRSELTTGGHSGLDNPAMPAALTNQGVRVIGSDISRTNAYGTLGTATKMPRWPTGIYYNVGTIGEQLDEYNYLNYELCKGTGNPGCLQNPVDENGYIDNEASMIVRHILSNDPRPHYVHQSNLAEDGTLYPVADAVVNRYRSYLNTPFIQPSYTDTNAVLAQQAAWRNALANGTVSGTISVTGLSLTATQPVAVPLSGTSVGSLYGGLRSGWMSLPVGTTKVGL